MQQLKKQVLRSVLLRRLLPRRMRRNSADAAITDAASVLRRQAVMLRNGAHTAAPQTPSQQNTVAEQIHRLTAVLFTVAQRSGAPWTWGCDSLAAALGSLLELRQRRRVLLAGSISNTVLIASLPLFAVVLGQLVGFNAFAVFTSRVGALLLTGGALSLAAGVYWMVKLVLKTVQRETLKGVECELVALALLGAVPLDRAKLLVADAICAHRAEWLNTDALANSGIVCQTLAARQGRLTGAVQVLQAAALAERQRALTEIGVRSEQLQTKILLPVAFCVLPAFVMLGVAPLCIAMLQGFA